MLPLKIWKFTASDITINVFSSINIEENFITFLIGFCKKTNI